MEGLMAFFLESTFIGLFFLGWEKLTKRQHLFVTFCTALGSNLSALWILVANGWMQNPAGSMFSAQTMRMEMVDFFDVLFNPVAQVKFVHTVAAGYVTAAMFVLAISAFYMLKGRDLGFAKRSFAIAAGFGLASVLSVIVLGDESGYTLGDVQKTKLAAIEAEYDTDKAPAAFTAIGIPNDKTLRTDYAIKVPWALGLIATRSINKQVTGIKDLMVEHETRIRSGMIAYGALLQIRKGTADGAVTGTFDAHKADLGYGLLLKKYTENVVDATPEQIASAVKDTIPPVAPLFFGFRLMVGLGLLMLFLIGASFYFTMRRTIERQRWLLRMLLWCFPAPWIACELGWFVAEFGRQPWAIGEVLPTFLATSSLTSGDLIFSLIGFVTFYSILLVVEVFLMVKFARKGPASLGTGKYHGEVPSPQDAPLFPAA
jgi:cytochrome d ubiquinol oxidase subunit I